MFIKVALILLILDYFWISLNQKSYMSSIEAIQKSPAQINFMAAALAYLCLIGLMMWVVLPRMQNWEPCERVNLLAQAGLIGMLVYGTYNFTTLALLKDYSWNVALKDTLWGGVLFATSAWLIKTI